MSTIVATDGEAVRQCKDHHVGRGKRLKGHQSIVAEAADETLGAKQLRKQLNKLPNGLARKAKLLNKEARSLARASDRAEQEARDAAALAKKQLTRRTSSTNTITTTTTTTTTTIQAAAPDTNPLRRYQESCGASVQQAILAKRQQRLCEAEAKKRQQQELLEQSFSEIPPGDDDDQQQDEEEDQEHQHKKDLPFDVSSLSSSSFSSSSSPMDSFSGTDSSDSSSAGSSVRDEDEPHAELEMGQHLDDEAPTLVVVADEPSDVEDAIKPFVKLDKTCVARMLLEQAHLSGWTDEFRSCGLLTNEAFSRLTFTTLANAMPKLPFAGARNLLCAITQCKWLLLS